MPTIAKPAPGEDVRKLHNYVRELVKGTNALVNMSATIQGRISGLGGLEISGDSAILRIGTGDPGAFQGGQNKKPTSCTIASSLNPAEYGDSVHWVATVAKDATGTIQFFIDGAAVGAPVKVANGVAVSITIVGGTQQLPPGNHIIQANYSGDYLYFPVSATLWQIVQDLNAPTVVAFGNPNPATEGGKIFLGANVTAENPIPPAPNLTGSVRFYINGSNYTDAPLTFLSGNTWRAVTGNAADKFGAGNTVVLAKYLGDNNYRTASGSYTQKVLRISTVKLTIAPNPVQPNIGVVFYVSVTGAGGVPTGNITLFLGGEQWGVPLALTNGQRAVNWSAGFGLGNYQFTAHYDGDDRYASDVSDAVTLNVSDQIGFDIETHWNPSGGANNIFQETVNIFNHNDVGSPQSVRVMGHDSYCEVRNVIGQVLYAGPMVFLGGTPAYYNTPCFSSFTIGPPGSWGVGAGCVGWFKYSIQYASGATEQHLYLTDPTGYSWLDSQPGVIACFCGMSPP